MGKQKSQEIREFPPVYRKCDAASIFFIFFTDEPALAGGVALGVLRFCLLQSPTMRLGSTFFDRPGAVPVQQLSIVSVILHNNPEITIKTRLLRTYPALVHRIILYDKPETRLLYWTTLTFAFADNGH